MAKTESKINHIAVIRPDCIACAVNEISQNKLYFICPIFAGLLNQIKKQYI